MKIQGLLMMLIGAIIMAILMFVDLPLSFTVWVIFYVLGMIIAATGAIMLIVYLAKQVKHESAEKRKQIK